MVLLMLLLLLVTESLSPRRVAAQCSERSEKRSTFAPLHVLTFSSLVCVWLFGTFHPHTVSVSSFTLHCTRFPPQAGPPLLRYMPQTLAAAFPPFLVVCSLWSTRAHEG
uniref:Putative secreted protein n=1 Tax=Anopheles darlingi TaxID=43151 RepID=A0A2M4DLF2_ANODA